MSEAIHFGLTTSFVKEQFGKVLKKQGSLAKAITILLNRDKYLTAKYRFRSLARCEVWQEFLRPGADSLANLSPVLHMLDTYVKFNRLESRAAALEELLQATESKIDKDFNYKACDDKSSDADAGLGDSWPRLHSEGSHEQSFIASGNELPPLVIHGSDEIMKSTFLSRSSSVNVDSATQIADLDAVASSTALLDAFCQTDDVFSTDVSVQANLCSCTFEVKLPDIDKILTATIQSNSTNQLASDDAIKLISTAECPKTNVDFLEPIIPTKRPRKALPSNEMNLISSAPLAVSNVALSSCSCSPGTFSSQMLSDAPMFNSVAPSQLFSSQTSLSTVCGNVYKLVYRGQSGGIPVQIPPLQQSIQNRFSNPQVVLSPMTLLSSSDVVPQAELYRPNPALLGQVPYPVSVLRSGVVSHAIPQPNHALPNNTAIISSAHPFFTPSSFSNFNSDTSYKVENNLSDGFPVPNATTDSAISSNNQKQLCESREVVAITTEANINKEINAGNAVVEEKKKKRRRKRSSLQVKKIVKKIDHSYSAVCTSN